MADSDRELLEWAANACGWKIDFLSADHWANVYEKDGRQASWNPLTDDGDALRLAVKLELPIAYVSGQACVSGLMAPGMDANEACRLAIVRAAAAIGKGAGG